MNADREPAFAAACINPMAMIVLPAPVGGVEDLTPMALADIRPCTFDRGELIVAQHEIARRGREEISHRPSPPDPRPAPAPPRFAPSS
jgi:hypothetical protein